MMASICSFTGLYPILCNVMCEVGDFITEQVTLRRFELQCSVQNLSNMTLM